MKDIIGRKILTDINDMPKLVLAETTQIIDNKGRKQRHRVYLDRDGNLYSARSLSVKLGLKPTGLSMREQRLHCSDPDFLVPLDEANRLKHIKAKKTIKAKNEKQNRMKVAKRVVKPKKDIPFSGIKELTPFEKAMPLPHATKHYKHSDNGEFADPVTVDTRDGEAIAKLRKFNSLMEKRGFLRAEKAFVTVPAKVVKTIDEAIDI